MPPSSSSKEEVSKILNLKRKPIRQVSCSQIDNQNYYELAEKQFRLNQIKQKQMQKKQSQIFDFDSLIQKNRQFCCKCRRSLSLTKSIFIHHYRKYYCVVCFSQHTILKTKQLSQYMQGDTWSHIKFRYQIINCKNIHLQTNQWISLWTMSEDFALIKGIQRFGTTSFGEIRSYFSEIGISKSKKQIQEQFQQFQKYLVQEQNEKEIMKISKIQDKKRITNQNSKMKSTQNNSKKWNKMNKAKKEMLKFLDFDQKRWQFQRNSGSALDVYEIILSQLDEIQSQLDSQEIQDFSQVKQIFLEQYIEKQTNFENACRFLIETDFLQGKYIASQLDQNLKEDQVQQTIAQQLLKQLFQDQIQFSIPYIQHKSSLKSSQSFIQKQKSDNKISQGQKEICIVQNHLYEDLIQDSQLKSEQTDLSWICQKKRRKQIYADFKQKEKQLHKY